MAESMIAGLFGMTPDMYQRQQYQQDLKTGYELAQLDPGAAARAQLGANVGQIGRGLAGAMGVQDPALNRMTQRNQLLQELDLTNPLSMREIAKKASSIGDNEFAMALVDKAIKTESEMALTQQRIAQATRERQQAIPTDIQVANQIADLEDTLSQLENAPSSPERTRAKNLLNTRLAELRRLSTKVDKEPKFGDLAERFARQEYGIPFAQLTQDQARKVNSLVEESQGKVAEKGASKTYLPGQPVQPKDWMAFDQNVLSKDPTMQRTSTILSDAPSAIDIIRSSTTNDISAATLPGALARLTGEGKNMSNADVNRYARTGGLDDRLAQDAVKFFTGRTTEVKKDQAERFATALYRGALIERKKKLVDSAEQYGYSESPNYKVALRQIDDQLGQFTLKTKGAHKESIPEKTGNPLIDKYLSRSVEKQ